MSEIMEIKASDRLIDILRDYPEVTDYFLKMGICACGDEDINPNWTADKFADEKGIDLNKFLEEINKRIKK